MRKLYSARRPCKDYEKTWGKFCADKGLDDHWLEVLTSLQDFDLYKICVGHEKRRGIEKQFPQINIEQRHFTYMNFIPGKIPMFLNSMNLSRMELFPDRYFEATFDFDFSISLDTGREYLRSCNLRIKVSDCYTSEMETHSYEWFDKAVKNIAQFDAAWGDLVGQFLITKAEDQKNQGGLT